MRRDLFLTILAAAHGVVPQKTPSNANCETCFYRQAEWRDGGFCYFWKENRGPCHKFELLTPPPSQTSNEDSQRLSTGTTKEGR